MRRSSIYSLGAAAAAWWVMSGGFPGASLAQEFEPPEPRPLQAPKKPEVNKSCEAPQNEQNVGLWTVYWNGVTNTTFNGRPTTYQVGDTVTLYETTTSTQVDLAPSGLWTVQVRACPGDPDPTHGDPTREFFCSEWSPAASIQGYDPTTDTACTGGSSCSSVGASTVVVVDDKGRFRPAGSCAYERSYVESPPSGGRFLMEEWSVLSYGAASGARADAVVVENASSGHFARAKARCLMEGTLGVEPQLLETPLLQAKGDAQGADRPALVVIDHTPHALNERYMPDPWVSLRDAAGLDTVAATAARAVVRIEVGASGAIGRVDLVHADGELPGGALEAVAERLEIDYVDERRHRMVLFALLSLGRPGIELVDTLVTLPKCCQGCPPPPFHCP